MKKYIVEITETLVRQIQVVAVDGQSARNKVRQLYQQEKIVLDYSDFFDLEFNVLDNKQTIKRVKYDK